MLFMDLLIRNCQWARNQPAGTRLSLFMLAQVQMLCTFLLIITLRITFAYVKLSPNSPNVTLQCAQRYILTLHKKV